MEKRYPMVLFHNTMLHNILIISSWKEKKTPGSLLMRVLARNGSSKPEKSPAQTIPRRRMK